MLVVVGLVGYLTGRRFPHPGAWIGRRREALVRVAGPWRRWSRPLLVAGAVIATAPVWPMVQPGDPIADEMLEPAEVAVLVPVVLTFPVAWALLGRSRPHAWRIGAGLVAWVAAWAVWTVVFGSWSTPPNIDDGLRWHLIGAAAIVAAGAWGRQPLTRRWLAGTVIGAIGVAVVFAIPVAGGPPMPARDAIPLPATATVIHEETGCGWNSCYRRLTVTGIDEAGMHELARRSGCRRIGWLNPYELCLDLRRNEPASTVGVQVTYYNGRDRVVFMGPASIGPHDRLDQWDPRGR
ncbi:hypothetical protein GCM10010112_16190 [Actinoplanes lobatus]|nr:hypothetical protein GCM10010112_16190 [Actinoplanes lobatus]GIE37981.1 hypothetical protein Alo02nite_08790 [Actinoplanes lobatus]